MPTISEQELNGGEDQYDLCSECREFEGSIWLCGEGYICEGCFTDLADIKEEDLYNEAEDRPLLDFEVPKEHTARVKAKLMYKRGTRAEDQE